MTRRKTFFQIRIELLGVDPPIWRRLEVPAEYTFWDLHVAIQDAMGWQDSHLHHFRFIGSQLVVGIPDEDGGDILDTRAGWKYQIMEHMSDQSPLVLYEYDFGDSWLHELRFEDARPLDPVRNTTMHRRSQAVSSRGLRRPHGIWNSFGSWRTARSGAFIDAQVVGGRFDPRCSMSPQYGSMIPRSGGEWPSLR